MVLRAVYKFALLLLILFNPNLCAQTVKEFGDVSIGDFTKLDSVEAVILFDEGNVVVDLAQVHGTVFKRHVRILILKKAGLNYGTFQFEVNKNAFTRPRGFTFNLENGKIIKTPLEDASIMVGKYSKGIETVSVAFPNVREGSIVDFSYALQYEGYYLPGWEFQHDIPTLFSEYALHSPIGDYVYHLYGSIKPSKFEEKYEGKFRTWTMTNIPAFKPEVHMPDEKLYMSSIEFGTQFKKWDVFNDDMVKRKSFGEILIYHSFLKRKLREVTAGLTDSLQMIRAISHYIKDQVAFNGVDDFLATPPEELLDAKEGTTGDINLMFGSLLKKAGFNVEMVVLSTRGNGYILEEFTSSQQFNYVVCMVKVNNKEIFVDATEKLLPYNLLPPRCYNHKGFLVSSKFFGWVPIEPSHRDKTFIEAELVVNERGDVGGKFKVAKYDYAAFKLRKRHFQQKEDNLEKDLPGNPLWDITKAEIENTGIIDKPLLGTYEAAINGYATVAGDFIYLNPNLFLQQDVVEFSQPSRVFPIDLAGLTDNFVSINLTVPEGYEVKELPSGKVFTLPENAARCTFTTSQVGDRLTVITRLQINKTLFQPFEYANLREFFSTIIAKKAENIVLKKKL